MAPRWRLAPRTRTASWSQPLKHCASSRTVRRRPVLQRTCGSCRRVLQPVTTTAKSAKAWKDKRYARDQAGGAEAAGLPVSRQLAADAAERTGTDDNAGPGGHTA